MTWYKKMKCIEERCDFKPKNKLCLYLDFFDRQWHFVHIGAVKKKATVILEGLRYSMMFLSIAAVTPKQEEWLSTDPKKNLRHLSPGECSGSNSRNTALEPQAPWITRTWEIITNFFSTSNVYLTLMDGIK